MGLKILTMCVGPGGLWTSTGTAATTHQVTGFGGEEPDEPADVISFVPQFDVNGSLAGQPPRFETLFSNKDANGQIGLWVSDGTGAGTHEITGISGVDPNGGLDPTYMTRLPANSFFLFANAGVLFAGNDSNGNNNLWVTDGTAAGTHELTVQGANPNGLDPAYLTDLNGKIYFAGTLPNDRFFSGLWVTDGTAAGTQLVTNGSANHNFGFDPQFITLLNFSEMLFKATNGDNGIVGLWVSDGTAGGTHELTGISGASSNGLFFGAIGTPGFARSAHGTVFDGVDANNQQNLWVTDGTAAGTHELTGISGASASGLAPAEMTSFPGGVLFQGIDASGNESLWITDGTAAGTHELTGISGAPSSFQPGQFTVFGNDVLFDGNFTGGGSALWETDGTAAGTHVISVAGVSPLATVVVSAAPPEDFTDNFISDVLFRNQATGEVDTWLMNNGKMAGGTVLGDVSSAWRFVGTGDITGNGTSDVMWQNTATGEVDSWLINNGHMKPGGGTIGSASSVWQPLGTGEFNGDGISDLLWRNTATGEVDTWLMNNGQVNGGSAVGSVSSAWQFAGMGDFNGDGITDVLWHNTTTGEVDTWLINNGQLSGGAAIGHASSAWQALGTGDFLGGFNGTGSDGILWRNTVTGEVDTWIMNNGQVVGGTALGSVSTAWQFTGIGDYNGSGTSSVLWRNINTGEVDTWIISNDQVTGGSAIGGASTSWQPQVIHTA